MQKCSVHLHPSQEIGVDFSEIKDVVASTDFEG